MSQSNIKKTKIILEICIEKFHYKYLDKKITYLQLYIFKI